jgi:hypothetical protein
LEQKSDIYTLGHPDTKEPLVLAPVQFLRKYTPPEKDDQIISVNASKPEDNNSTKAVCNTTANQNDKENNTIDLFPKQVPLLLNKKRGRPKKGEGKIALPYPDTDQATDHGYNLRSRSRKP